ncbi:L,D-peptidoglycan transpeptidase YkuD (ErfK/YbiS/YcfS/YnhG family) [Nocardia transvalensis]|uniref:L,D-peptidoglycan transpeptidase YkuD (ErfK/YbiS/YcfS/YnhG family) n=1 Tax=Nocardia transvalensis TaxID=37333 RepID=A0A7W9PM68_9NOCA|nr:hypothetical protein [Nocardia transvalensis]MBB5918505.1 L,D-peptidoglycan transpeptidase YkuD (ErfK/YbiS/YcfS/YnhG family) [Nocardia transvalensis]
MTARPKWLGRSGFRWISVSVVVLVAAAVLVLVLVPRSEKPPFDPASVPGTQVVWVTAPAGADHGTLELWQRPDGADWERTLAVPAWVGAEGISTRAREGASYTPEGIFPLSEGFGRLPVPANLPYLQVDSSNTWWWVSDPGSPLYNQKYRCAEPTCPFDTTAAENLARTAPQYDYALVIDYNRTPTIPGDGSAFFLHVSANEPTAGCVAVDPNTMHTLLTTLHPARHPVIGMHPT